MNLLRGEVIEDIGIPTVRVIRQTEHQVVIACPYCPKEHYHGLGDGHRVAHCDPQYDSVNVSGYYIVGTAGVGHRDPVEQYHTETPVLSIPAEISHLIATERLRQEKLHPRKTCASRNVNEYVKLGVLMEEVGEIAKALLEEHDEEYVVAELTQVAAVCVAWLESLL
jgi:hypothetical protein